MRKSSKCKYTIGVNTKFKKKFLRPEWAIAEAEKVNAKTNSIKKMVAYKCTTCQFFHIGRSYDDIVRPQSVYQPEVQIVPVPIPKIVPVKKVEEEFDWVSDRRILKF